MKNKLFVIPLLILILNSCNPKLNAVILNQRPALSYDSEV